MLDEPFGALDQFTREELWSIMQNLWMTRRPTVMLVTHDLKESAYLANRICVMRARPGRIIEDRAVPFARPRTIEMTYPAGLRGADPAFARRHLRRPAEAALRAQRDVDRAPSTSIASAALIIGFFLLWEFLCWAFKYQQHRAAAAERDRR